MAPGLGALVLLSLLVGTPDKGDRVKLSATLDAIDARQVTRATLYPGHVVIILTDGSQRHSSYPNTYNDDLIAQLHQRRVPFDFKSDALRGFGVLFVLLIPLAAFAFFWAWLARRLPRPERSPERP